MEMNRRSFLSATVVGSAASLASIGVVGQAFANESSGPAVPTIERKADIVIVGAGGAGLCAALTAGESGANVILLEAQPMTGGATLGSTATNVGGSQMQRAAGIDDNPDQIFASYSNDIANEYVLECARTYADNNGATYDWLKDVQGIAFSDEVQFFPPYPVARIVYPIGGGAGTVATLTENLANFPNVELMLETTATDLVKVDGTVTGVKAVASDGTQINITTKAVILAGGGFAADIDMIPYTSVSDAMYYGLPSSDGKSMSLALHAGAQLLDMGVVPLEGGGLETEPGKGTQLYSVSLLTYKNAAGILVGSNGQRLFNEVGAPAPSIVAAYRSLPDSTAYLFMDKASWDVFYAAGTRKVGGVFSPETMEEWLALDGAGLPIIVTADTVEEVAAKVGIDAEGLKATIAEFNADAPSGVDSKFQRPIAAAIGEGPYYIAAQKLRYAHSFGGLVANGALQVLDWSNTPIPGLYAAGQLLRSIQGNFSKASTSTSFAYTSGRVAAINALQEL